MIKIHIWIYYYILLLVLCLYDSKFIIPVTLGCFVTNLIGIINGLNPLVLDLIVGYIDNLPYEGMIGNKFTGLTDTYLSKFASMTGVTYKYVEYKSTKDLSSDLSNMFYGVHDIYII